MPRFSHATESDPLQRLTGILLLFGILLLAGCRHEAQEKPEEQAKENVEETAGEPVPVGDIRASNGFYRVVFYYAPQPEKESLATARTLVERLLPSAGFVTHRTNTMEPPYVGFTEEEAPLIRYPFPDESYLKFSGRGLGDEEAAGYRKSAKATRLVLVAPSKDVWSLGRRFTQLVQEYADATGACIWDSATRECFSREAWKQRRLDVWEEEGIPDLSRQFTIHLYQSDESTSYLRAITLGMEKFALPDVVIEQLIGSDNRPAGNLINLVCQSLAERPIIQSGQKETFRIGDMNRPELRASMEEWLEKGATKEITLELLQGRSKEGDPENRLIEISFRNGVGASNDERRESQLSKLWGATDSVVGVKHTDEILEASKRAKSKLGGLRALFLKGLPPGSRLLVKAPFQRDDEGNEWMWVETMKWPTPGKIEGILQNDPFYVAKLKAGAAVEIATEDVFDYLFYKEDGTVEGNETGKLMERQGGSRKTK